MTMVRAWWYTCLLWLFLQQGVFTQLQNIHISIFNNVPVTSVVVSVVEGSYAIVADSDLITTIKAKENIYLSRNGDNITVIAGDRQISCRHLAIRGVDSINIFKIRSVFPEQPPRIYCGDVSMKIDFERLMMINTVTMDDYLGGVIETEGGASALEEYYKAQAILCRTYALKNLHRHADEGFELCDGTHCQAYKSKCLWNADITDAVKSTENEVVVYADSVLITSAFHANSGGQTMDAKDVWLMDAPYLKSVHDPFSTKSSNAQWTATFPRADWMVYLTRNGYTRSNTDTSVAFSQVLRAKDYTIGTFSMPLSRIREDWKLKSTYFSVVDDPPNVILKGKGYGHGVGMSQQGAMQMAKSGFTFEDIIHFYYTNVSIVQWSERLR